MSNLVIVAIPDENDRVWKVSSEQVPHMTLLFLGDADQVDNTQSIVEFVEHAANTTLKRFYMTVDRRGELGDDKADVLFFKRSRYDFRAIHDFRSQLLKDDNIRTAYDSTEQFEGPWKPHLTLGYPETPAKPQDADHDYPFYDVSFNKIAVWFGDFDGPEFLLKDYWDDFESMDTVAPSVAMSGIIHHGADSYEQSVEMGTAFLAHYGVKGMRWGQRKDEAKGGWLDPSGKELKDDVIKTAAGVVFPPIGILTIPANIRLTRAAGRHVITANKERREAKGEKKQAKQDAKDDAKFEKVAKSQEGFVAIHNGAQAKMNRDIDAINKKYPGDLTKSPSKQKAYDAEVLKSMQNAYRESANSLSNKRGDKHLDVEFKNDGMDFAIKVREGAPTPTREVEHAATIDDNDVVTLSGKIKRYPTGHIQGFDFEDFDQPDMIHTMGVGAEFLEHYGVKGMRWGVTREQLGAVGNAAKATAGAVGKAANAVGTFAADVHFESKTVVPAEGGWSKAKDQVYDAAHKPYTKTDLPAVKARHGEYGKLRNRAKKPFSKEARAYRKDARETYVKRLETEANKITNVSGTRQYTVRERGIDQPAQGGNLPTSKRYWEVTARDIKHAAIAPDILIELVEDSEGWITDLKPVELAEPKELAQSNLEVGLEFLTSLGIPEESLEHFGVKGMRWGVRKPPPTAVATTASSHVPHGTKRKTKVKVEGGENHPASDDALKVAQTRAKLQKSGVATLSNAELRDLNQRLQLETQAAQLTSSRGSKFIQRQLEQQGQQTVQLGARKVGKKVGKKVVKKAVASTVPGAALFT